MPRRKSREAANEAAPKRTRTKSGATKPRARQPEDAVAPRLPAPDAAARSRAQRAFERGVISRGEAAPADAPLPPGATHAIVGKTAAGKPVLKRRRFSTH